MALDALRGRRAFITTNWQLVRNNELAELVERYWGPVYHYLLKTGRTEVEAEDLTQEFFADSLEACRFSKAEPARGRFRAFLLSSLDNFLRNIHRASQAQKRRPPGGVVSMESLADENGRPFDIPTPEMAVTAFNRAWATELIIRVLNRLELECRAKEKQDYFEVFRLCIIEPALSGGVAPPREQLAAEYRITGKELSNRLITARRAYQRLLREEIRTYAKSEDEVDAEMLDLMREVGSR